MATPHHRLPRTFLPSHYDVLLHATPRRKTFSGVVQISGALQGPQRHIELHARGLRLSEATVAGRGGRRQRAEVRLQRARETAVVSFARPLQGPVTLTLRFAGKLNPNMHGLYLAEDGPERAIASQCQATDARAIFPCLDEPDFKASLGWRVQTDAGLQVITNGALRQRRAVRGTREELHTFVKTRRFSTYLAAVAIGHFESGPALKVGRTACRVFAGRGKAEQTAFARQVTAQVLPYYSDYFGHPYPFDKLDQVAVPGFDAGAMENVGAIFYRQTLLLMRQKAVSWGGQKRIAEVIAHEIAHQWFGNLVTMAWWDDLWLNEAFATWIAYKACDHWRPEWRMWDDFLESKQAALVADALHHTHPIYTEVQSPAEATELFDVITYEKGCATLRMVESFMGEAAFRRGIAAYIERHKNGNARGADLWGSLSAQTSTPVESLMQGWITQAGFPLVRCRVERRAGTTHVHLRQQRFFASAAAMQKPDDGRWQVPLILQYGVGNKVRERRVTLRDEATTVTLPGTHDVAWVYPNGHAAGFYRVLLDPTDLRALLQHGLQRLTPGTRTALLEDQWALVENGESDVAQFLDLLWAYRHERDHIVVRAMVGQLHGLSSWVGAAAWPALRRFACALLRPQFDELGFAAAPDEPPPRAVRRACVIGALGDVGRDPEILRQAVLHMQQELQDPLGAEPNLAGTVIALSALSGTGARLALFVRTYLERKQAGESPQLQARYIQGITAFEGKRQVATVFSMCLDGTIPQEQLRSVLTPLLVRRKTQAQTWKFLASHWAKLRPRVGGMGIARLVEATGALPARYKKTLDAFFEANPVPEATRARRKALEAMDLRAALVRREARRAAAWLSTAPPA